MDFNFDMLQTITNNFSDENRVGSGLYGEVYKGKHNGEEIAVKKLNKFYAMLGFDDEEFHNELCILSKVEHQNIVRFIGYCYERGHKHVEHKGQLTVARETEQLLCFEYMKGGSLDKYITDESCDLDWTTCYQIIKGTSDGLNHLHSLQPNPIFHLNLKPSNILLDTNMTAKIADFNMSSLVASTKTYGRGILQRTPWWPPEYLFGRVISHEFDVFSLGFIILELMDGNNSHSRFHRMGAEQFIKHVRENWKKRLQPKSGNLSDKIDTLRVETCVEIASRCVAVNPNKRPLIKDIVNELEQLEAKIKKMSQPNVRSKDLTGQIFWRWVREKEELEGVLEYFFTGNSGIGDSASAEEAVELPVSAWLGSVGPVLRQLKSLVASSHTGVGPIKEKLWLLGTNLAGLYSDLKDLSEASGDTISITAKCWMSVVRELCYDAEDCLDEVFFVRKQITVLEWKKGGIFLRKTTSRWLPSPHRKMLPSPHRRREPLKRVLKRDLSKVIYRADDASERCQGFCLGAESTVKPGTSIARQAVAMPQLHAESLLNLLCFDKSESEAKNQPKVVPIFGFAGVGKTRMATTLYHRYRVQFQCWAFVRVSSSPDFTRLLTSILSQIKAPPANAFSDVQDLIDTIRSHLRDKRYFIVVDDLWTASVWDTISRAFPAGDCGSRIITTTQILDVALACCSYQSKYIFKMTPLNDEQSRKLFHNGVFGSEDERSCPENLKEVSDGIIRKCGGLPFALVNTASLLVSIPNLSVEQWKGVQDSLPSTLSTNPTSEGMKEFVKFIYNNLPPHMKTCLLYLIMYPEGGAVRKDELVKQWVAEGFIGAVEGQDKEETAGCYFDVLVSRGMIQPVDTNYYDEVLSCAVHRIVLDLIRCDAMEENFITIVNYLQTPPGLPDKVRRLSLQFGGAKSAKTPASLRLSQLRSLLFCGFSKVVPSIMDYEFLRVLILHIWADKDGEDRDLTIIRKLFRLRYLKIKSNMAVKLPDKILGLQYLGTLQVDAKLSAIPSDIVHLHSLLHLRVPSESNLPNGTCHMTSLRTLGYFDLSSNSADNVMDLGELINLQDLHLTCSTLQSSDNLETNLKCLGLILGKLISLRCLTLVPTRSSHSQIDASSWGISCDAIDRVPPPPLLQRLEVSRFCCFFSRLPVWIGELNKLCVLKIAVRELSVTDIDILKELPALAVLSLHIKTAPAERFVFGKAGFSLLMYFKFRCSVPLVKFEADSMPNLRKLKLGFDASISGRASASILIERLPGLEEISAKIGGAGADAESVLTAAVWNHPDNPRIIVQLMDHKFNGHQGTAIGTKQKEHKIQDDHKGEDVKKQAHSGINSGMEDGTLVRGFVPHDLLEKRTDGFTKDWELYLNQGKMVEAIFIAISSIGEVLVDEAVSAVVTKLSAKVNNLNELPVKVEKIAKQLRMMNNLILDLGTSHMTQSVVKGWIAEVRKVAHHVEDVMDKYSYEAHKFKEESRLSRYILKSSQHIKVFSGIADEVVQIEDEIKQVQDMHKDWPIAIHQIQNKPASGLDKQRSGGCFPELVNDDDLVGIEGNRNRMTEWLNSDEKECTLMTVSGMGGLGKTTLVKNVYDREKINFPGAHAWVVVSQAYDVVDLLETLLRKMGKQPPPVKGDVYELTEEIKKTLQDRKFLIVLDDVWEKEAYTQIRGAFHGLRGSHVMITTRKEDVASLAPLDHRLLLQPLGSDDSLNLFCRRAFHNCLGRSCPLILKEMANDIAKRCHGLPLAIVTAGSLLSTKEPTEYAWSQMYKQLQSQLQKSDHIQAILNMSYSDLPGDLRNCFIYCSMFPEDYPIMRESLVRLWVAEGFAVQRDKSTLEEVAYDNLMELISRNLLQVVERDELGRVSTCKMHDIVRHLALAVAKEERFGSANNQGEMIRTDKHVRRFSTYRWRGHVAPSRDAAAGEFPCLRTILSLEGTSSSINMISSVLSGSKYLTVLELQDSAITLVPPSIGDLFNLRYIGLRGTNIESLPDTIEKLSRLQTLDTKQTRIQKLPPGIVKAKNLRHLLADSIADKKRTEFRYFIGVEAPKMISNLEQLQTLETVKASKELSVQLKKLSKLQTVWVDNIRASDCEDIFSALSGMPLLSSLLLSACDENEPLRFEALNPISERLHRLIIRGRWARETLKCPMFQYHGKNLKYLALSWCNLGREDPLQVLAPHMPALTYLSLNRVSSAATLVIYAGCFLQLKTLVLKCMHDVKWMEIGEGALPCIEGMYIMSSRELNTVPQGIESLRSLKKLWLLDLHKDFKTEWFELQMHTKVTHVTELRV